MVGNQDPTERTTAKEDVPAIGLDEALAEFKPSSQAVSALKHLAWASGELVNETVAGLFIGLVHGDLVIQSQVRLPLKKLILFVASLLAVGLVCWTMIYPWIARIQISIR